MTKAEKITMVVTVTLIMLVGYVYLTATPEEFVKIEMYRKYFGIGLGGLGIVVEIAEKMGK